MKGSLPCGRILRRPLDAGDRVAASYNGSFWFLVGE